jgi:hypothetical protein
MLSWAWRIGLVILVLASLALRIEIDKYQASKMVLDTTAAGNLTYYFPAGVR